MIFFNDPEPSPSPCVDAARFALGVMRDCRSTVDRWRRSGFSLDVAAGIAYGFATLGSIGYGDRIDYGAIGSVTNLAARLCGEAEGGHILVSARAAAALPATFGLRTAGPFRLKGFRDPVPSFVLGNEDDEVPSI
jgi:class 3 adenylate cyclase